MDMQSTELNGKRLEWELTFGTIRRIRARTGLDLLKPHEPIDDPAARPLQRLMEDPGLIVDTLAAVLEPIGVTTTDVDTITAAQIGAFFESLVGGWVDFFRQAGQPAKANLILNHLQVMTDAADEYQKTIQESNLSEVMKGVIRSELEGVIGQLGQTSKP